MVFLCDVIFYNISVVSHNIGVLPVRIRLQLSFGGSSVTKSARIKDDGDFLNSKSSIMEIILVNRFW